VKKARESPDLFICPLVPFVPLMGMACSIHIALGQGANAFYAYGVWVVVGLIIYGLYGYHQKAEREYEAR